MVSIGPNSQSLNFTHMWNQRDLRGILPLKQYTENYLMYHIDKNPDFTKFNYMVKLAKLETMYDGYQSNFTIFIPSDALISKLGEDIFLNMDQNTAKKIVKSSTLKEKIPIELLEDCKATYVYTIDIPNRLFISNIRNETFINNNSKVVYANMMATNGIIHVVDNLLHPLII